jgi:hypothetical protein
VSLVPGDAQEIFPGITCYTGGKHTFQSQYVGVNTKAGMVILASDNMYLYENLEKHVPIAQTLDAVSNLHAQDRKPQALQLAIESSPFGLAPIGGTSRPRIVQIAVKLWFLDVPKDRAELLPDILEHLHQRFTSHLWIGQLR